MGNPDALHGVMLRAIETLTQEAEIDAISVRHIAERMLELIDPRHLAPELEQLAAIEGMSQRARSWLRSKRDDIADTRPNAEPDLFEGDLPKRVAICRNDEFVYMARDLTTPDEIDDYIRQRRRAVSTEQRRLQALQRWNEARKQTGRAA